MKAYKKNYKNNQKLINTEKYSKEIFSLPLYPELKIKIILKIIKSIRKILDKI
jgi:dTDP-4-amino-4,6-dideoxygalactose transaminase